MTTTSKTPNTPSFSLRLVSKRVKFHFQANMPLFHPRWLLVLVAAAIIWWVPNLNQYVNIVISLIGK